MATDPLERPATRSLVEELHGAGLLSDAARVDALERLSQEGEWWPPLNRLLATLGTALVVVGVIVFFASNWQALSRFERLLLPALPLVLALAYSLWAGLDSLGGRLGLTAATVLTGVVVAVFGQVYQTGADAWQLFATWSLLTAGWMLLSRFALHVVLWLAVTQVALATLWEQELFPGGRQFPAGLCLALAAVSFGALAVFEWLARRPGSWVDRAWARRLLLAAGLGQLALPTAVLILGPSDSSAAGWVAAPACALAVAASWLLHRSFRRDLPSLAITALAGLIVVLSLIGKPLFEASDEWPMFLLFGLIVSAAVSGVVVLLRREQSAMRGSA